MAPDDVPHAGAAALLRRDLFSAGDPVRTRRDPRPPQRIGNSGIRTPRGRSNQPGASRRFLEDVATAGGSGDSPGADAIVASSSRSLRRTILSTGDSVRAPKFPRPVSLRFPPPVCRRTGDAGALDMVSTLSRRMRQGGIYDQIGGGFHRYSIDGEWRRPALRKDALRPGTARPGVSRCLSLFA